MTCKRTFSALLAVLLLMLSFAADAESLDTTRSVSLTVRFRHDGVGMQDAQFQLYHVASMDASGELTLLAPFTRYNVQLGGLSESELAGVATTLEGYILRDGIAPTYTASTNSNGSAYFEGMPQGLYLVLGDRYAAGDAVFTIQPSMVQLPFLHSVEGRWDYEVMMNAKYTFAPHATIVTRKVLKVWENVDGVTLPEQITVHLLRDGVIADTVQLSEECLWRYTWTELDATSRWTVVEEELDDYLVNVTQEGVTFVITNTYDAEEPGPTPTPSPDGPQLPQTGQLWWPVPMLMSLGLLLIVLGLLIRRRQ